MKNNIVFIGNISLQLNGKPRLSLRALGKGIIEIYKNPFCQGRKLQSDHGEFERYDRCPAWYIEKILLRKNKAKHYHFAVLCFRFKIKFVSSFEFSFVFWVFSFSTEISSFSRFLSNDFKKLSNKWFANPKGICWRNNQTNKNKI